MTAFVDAPHSRKERRHDISLDFNANVWRFGSDDQQLEIRVADSDRNEGQNPEAVTPDMLLNVIQGKATPKEHQIVRSAFNDPHSQLHDWLEGVEEWAQKFFGASDYHGESADRMLELAIARQHRDDVVAFLHRKRAEGKLTAEQLSALLAAGIPQPSADQPPESENYRRATSKMLELAVKLQPDLTAEIPEITKVRGQDKA